jgi:hypothetical protein
MLGYRYFNNSSGNLGKVAIIVSKDNTRIFFYGFVIGTVLLLMPIPHFFFWSGVIDHVETMFRYLGFVFFAVCGITIIVRVVRTFFEK